MTRFLSWTRWFYPGMRVKRWVSLNLLGIVLVVAGLVLFAGIDVLQWTSDAISNIKLYTPWISPGPPWRCRAAWPWSVSACC